MTPFGFDADFIDLMNAYSGGHFAKEGLDAKVLGAAGTVQHIQQVIAGQVDFGRFPASTSSARSAPRTRRSAPSRRCGRIPASTIVSLKDKPVTIRRRLKGKTIGLLSDGGTTQTFIEVLLAKIRHRQGQETARSSTGNSPGEVDLIRQGRIDCFICTYSVAFMLRQTKEPLEYLQGRRAGAGAGPGAPRDPRDARAEARAVAQGAARRSRPR